MLLGAGVIAGTANLLNLLDLRPGRALKVGRAARRRRWPAGRTAGSPPGRSAPPPALLADDLGERGHARRQRRQRARRAARAWPGRPDRAVGRAGRCSPVLAALTAASEKVSFTKVIERTPGLRELDALGRRSD